MITIDDIKIFLLCIFTGTECALIIDSSDIFQIMSIFGLVIGGILILVSHLKRKFPNPRHHEVSSQ